jgi:hypothetical protein
MVLAILPAFLSSPSFSASCQLGFWLDQHVVVAVVVAVVEVSAGLQESGLIETILAKAIS